MGWQAVGWRRRLSSVPYDNFGVPAADLAAARLDAQAVLQQAGVNIVWDDCWARPRAPGPASARCQEPVGGDIVLRLQKTGASRPVEVRLDGVLAGRAPPARHRSSRPCMSIASSRWPGVPASIARRVLGLAIAHEIGHVLLDSNAHAPSGLMRADWSRRELRHKDAGAWQFLDNEAGRVRSAAMGRR